MINIPHITVACVVERDGRYLMVREESNGLIVYNQPAGHLEPGESLISAAERETLEETGWRVEITDFLGIYHYTSPQNGTFYVRNCFIAKPIYQTKGVERDSKIIETCWLSIEEIYTKEMELRSPLVLKALKDFTYGRKFPLSLIHIEN
tara:strand:- start:1941 stop:2387 length:447 start_codon:yes stop_codon:yes gene_type:complete